MYQNDLFKDCVVYECVHACVDNECVCVLVSYSVIISFYGTNLNDGEKGKSDSYLHNNR